MHFGEVYACLVGLCSLHMSVHALLTHPLKIIYIHAPFIFIFLCPNCVLQSHQINNKLPKDRRRSIGHCSPRRLVMAIRSRIGASFQISVDRNYPRTGRSLNGAPIAVRIDAAIKIAEAHVSLSRPRISTGALPDNYPRSYRRQNPFVNTTLLRRRQDLLKISQYNSHRRVLHFIFWSEDEARCEYSRETINNIFLKTGEQLK